jgi:epoxyqueuosine reductase
VVDARRCISYTTIEQRGEIPLELREAQGRHVFGCDICQEVCPWNRPTRRATPDDPLGLRAEVAPSPAWVNPRLDWILGLDVEAWRVAARKTALKRSKWQGLMRNALVAAGNSGDVGLAPLIRAHAEGEDALLAEHARWALDRLGITSDPDTRTPPRATSPCAPGNR